MVRACNGKDGGGEHMVSECSLIKVEGKKDRETVHDMGWSGGEDNGEVELEKEDG